MQDVAGIEPLHPLEDQDQRDSVLPERVHTESAHDPSGTDDNGSAAQGSEGGGRGATTAAAGGLGRHSVHVVTQYYVPDNPRRAREVCVCEIPHSRHRLLHVSAISPSSLSHTQLCCGNACVSFYYSRL